MSLAVHTGIAPSVWLDEGAGAMLTAANLIEEMAAELAKPKG